MRLRVALGVALVLAVGELVLIMSGSARRISATDHINPVGFIATLKGGQELCQPAMSLPKEAGRVQVLIGTYGKPVPALSVRFLGPSGSVASGQLAASARQGNVSVPLSYPHGPTVAGTLCLHVGSSATNTVLGGDVFTPGPGSEQIAGKPQEGRIAVTYLGHASESWWAFLPELSRRFGLGKASFFGDWTLAAMALLLLGVWVATVRLLLRELT